MSPRKTKTKKLESHEWSLYKKKAEDFHRLALSALSTGNWNGAGLASIHSAISAADTLLGRIAGMRAASERHSDVYQLVMQHSQHSEKKHYADSLLELIEQKNFIEYESRLFTESEARLYFKKAERFLNWVLSQLPKNSQ